MISPNTVLPLTTLLGFLLTVTPFGTVTLGLVAVLVVAVLVVVVLDEVVFLVSPLPLLLPRPLPVVVSPLPLPLLIALLITADPVSYATIVFNAPPLLPLPFCFLIFQSHI